MMHQIHIFIKGVIIGLSIAVPVGPIGILCIRRTLAQGRLTGFLSGLGAATADAFYGAIAGFGLTFLSNLLIGQRIWLHLIGGGLLCILGTKTFFSKPAEQGTSVEGSSLWNAYLSTFFLTLTNPMTILFFGAVFAGLGIGIASDHHVTTGILVLGVFIGSAMWWIILTGFTGILQGLFNVRRLQWLNRIAGLIIIGFGLISLLGLLG
jgi:threonine/homoserine/homoserine lactone efflux protein